VLGEYTEVSQSYHFMFMWTPLLPAVAQLEFRIFHHLFCDAYNIQRNAFAFDQYVAKVYQRNLDQLLEIRLLDWFYVVVLLALNLVRVKLKLNTSHCEHHDYPCYTNTY